MKYQSSHDCNLTLTSEHLDRIVRRIVLEEHYRRFLCIFWIVFQSIWELELVRGHVLFLSAWEQGHQIRWTVQDIRLCKFLVFNFSFI